MSALPGFREDKTTQAASIILKRSGGIIKYIKLIKLLYLADRKALDLWERPITNDSYVCMKYGPVLSRTYNLIRGRVTDATGYWSEFISKTGNYYVSLRLSPPLEKLSAAEVEVIEKVFDKYGHMDEFELCDLTHDLPEYKDPGDSSIPIDITELLAAIGYDEESVHRITEELEQEKYIDEIFGQ